MSMIGRTRPVYWKLKPVVIKVYSIARSSIIGKNYISITFGMSSL